MSEATEKLKPILASLPATERRKVLAYLVSLNKEERELGSEDIDKNQETPRRAPDELASNG